MDFPDVLNPSLVGTYPAAAGAGGGYVWDQVLEYRVWCHPERGAPDDADGNDYFLAFGTFQEADDYHRSTRGSEEPLALVLQREYIEENEPGVFLHVLQERITEWPMQLLTRPRRTDRTIPDFSPPMRQRTDSTSFVASLPMCRVSSARPASWIYDPRVVG
jgi:hypothetical protein